MTSNEISSVSESAAACIRKHALLAGVAGLVPLPYIDVAGVGVVQVEMVRQLAAIYGVPIDLDVVKRLVTTMLGAKLTQTVFQWIASAVKSIPGPGTAVGEVIQGAISVSITYAMGKAAAAYFAQEGRLSDEQLKAAYSEHLTEGREFARNHMSTLTADARRDEFAADLEAIRIGLARDLGKDAEFVEAVGRAFKQIRQRVDEEADVDAQLQAQIEQTRNR